MTEPLGVLLVLASMPMIFRWVPQNPVYGFRIPATCKDKSVWYDANALSGRHLFCFGVALMLLDYCLTVSPFSRVAQRQIYYWISTLGLVTIVAIDWRTANRWFRERRSPALRR